MQHIQVSLHIFTFKVCDSLGNMQMKFFTCITWESCVNTTQADQILTSIVIADLYPGDLNFKVLNILAKSGFSFILHRNLMCPPPPFWYEAVV